MADQSFLGSGLRFPIQADPGTGRFCMAKGEESVKESVYIILMTAKGERYMSPGFGSRIHSYTFMDASTTMLNLMKSELTETLLAQEPRISDVQISFDQRSRRDCLFIDIEYTVSSSNTRDNLVFPFYLQAVKEADIHEPVEG